MSAPDGYIESLMEQYHDLLYRRCLRIVLYQPLYIAMIEDCLQEVFFKAYLHYDSIESCGNPYGWLVNCCKNYFRSLYRKNKRRTEILGPCITDPPPNVLSDPSDSILRWLEKDAADTTLAALKASLTPLEETVFQHYYENEMTMKETAEKNNLSIVSVRAAVDRIRNKLKGMNSFLFYLGFMVHIQDFAHYVMQRRL